VRNSLFAVCAVVTAFSLTLFSNGAFANAQNTESRSVFLVIRKNSSTVSIQGKASSIAHEIILRQTAQRHFGSLTIDIDLDVVGLATPGWSLVTELVLRALAHTEAARARVTATTVSIEGISSHPGEYSMALQRVENVLLDGMSMTSKVSEVATDMPFEQLCQRRFRAVSSSGKVEFPVSSSDFSLTAIPLLDAMIEIATDCPSTTILVTGYTDNRGNAAANEALGRARARRVIDYMAGRGVPVEQFDAASASIDTDNADDDSASSRRLSRRADLEMLLP